MPSQRSHKWNWDLVGLQDFFVQNQHHKPNTTCQIKYLASRDPSHLYNYMQLLFQTSHQQQLKGDQWISYLSHSMDLLSQERARITNPGSHHSISTCSRRGPYTISKHRANKADQVTVWVYKKWHQMPQPNINNCCLNMFSQ